MTSLQQTCNEYLIRLSEHQRAPKLENKKTCPCSPRAPNLLHVLPSRMAGWIKLCNPDYNYAATTTKPLQLEIILKRPVLLIFGDTLWTSMLFQDICTTETSLIDDDVWCILSECLITCAVIHSEPILSNSVVLYAYTIHPA